MRTKRSFAFADRMAVFTEECRSITSLFRARLEILRRNGGETAWPVDFIAPAK